jgi:cyanophycinase-like exopeptidase
MPAVNGHSLGPLVLAGSGEYTDTMDLVDRYLLDIIDGKPVVLIATACAMEGDERMSWWEQLGVAHFRKFGVEAVPVRIRDKAEADIEKHAEVIASAGLVWFSGGSAGYLAQSFQGTRSWHALEAANRVGAAVAGASGGLGVLNSNVMQIAPNLQGIPGPTGLGLADPIRAMSHFDRFAARRPEMVERAIENLSLGQHLAGVDEDTALVWLVWSAGAWRAMGHKRVQVFEKGKEPRLYHHGDVVDSLPPPGRNLTPQPPLRPAERGSQPLPD